jgi:hypothetical protein
MDTSIRAQQPSLNLEVVPYLAVCCGTVITIPRGEHSGFIAGQCVVLGIGVLALMLIMLVKFA